MSDENTLISAMLQCKEQGDGIGMEANALAILAINPDCVIALHLLGQVRLAQGLPAAAIELLNKALGLAPGNLGLMSDLGYIHYTQGELTEAAEHYRQCSLLDPAHFHSMHSQLCLEQWIFTQHKRRILGETSKSYTARMHSGFFQKYLSGANILDIGYRGGYGVGDPIVPQAIGVDLGYPGYDGIHLPFADNSQDGIYCSHCLEHIPAIDAVIRDWLRVLKVGGFLVVIVPHQYLYERKKELPSRHQGHIHFFTPGKLMAAFEQALPPNHYRVRHCQDNDLFYDYTLEQVGGCYEIEAVLEKIAPPDWELE